MKKILTKAGIILAAFLAVCNFWDANFRVATGKISNGVAVTRDGLRWEDEAFDEFDEGEKVIIIFGKGETPFKDEIVNVF